MLCDVRGNTGKHVLTFYRNRRVGNLSSIAHPRLEPKDVKSYRGHKRCFSFDVNFKTLQNRLETWGKIAVSFIADFRFEPKDVKSYQGHPNDFFQPGALVNKGPPAPPEPGRRADAGRCLDGGGRKAHRGRRAAGGRTARKRRADGGRMASGRTPGRGRRSPIDG